MDTFIPFTTVDAVPEGTLRLFTVAGTDMVVTRVAGQFYAVGARCTHYGGPLAKGILVGTTIMCPWHHACFNVTTGAMEQPPALDALPRYPLRRDGDQLLVALPAAAPTDQRLPDMAKPDPGIDSRTFVIVGSGAAGYMAAQTLREEGFQGRVVLLSADYRHPYDRPQLSKQYLSAPFPPHQPRLREDSFYDSYGIDLRLGTAVVGMDETARILHLADESVLAYDQLLLTPGSVPRPWTVPGADVDVLGKVFMLRSFEDAYTLSQAVLNEGHAVIIGSSFIGLETASSLTARGMSVTVVSPEAVPLGKILGHQIGTMVQRVHEARGVTFRLERQVTALKTSGDRRVVILDTGERLMADLIVVGIGVRPATDFVPPAWINPDDGSIGVDAHLRVTAGVYAAGDAARFPVRGGSARIEHWRTALQQGRVAARNMLGRAERYAAVPFFWTAQQGLTLRYVGQADKWDELIVHGSIDRHEFVALYVRDGQVRAAVGAGRDSVLSQLEVMLQQETLPDLTVLRQDPADWPVAGGSVPMDSGKPVSITTG